MKFNPKFEITPKIARELLRIEAVKQNIQNLPINLKVLHSLRESARLFSVHYSTQIEGNRLTQEQVQRVIEKKEQFPGRERDESEVRGYYEALAYLEAIVAKRGKVTESLIQTLHALTMNKGNTPSMYRDGQNVIRNAADSRIVYLPPEAKDVAPLMQALVQWIENQETVLPYPLIAAIAHYQFATIHPYYDGNGRTARLLTTFILHRGGYDLKGLFSLEEYYARNLQAYYDAISVGPSHNYYMGRAESDITQWIEYFCDGMADSFERVQQQALLAEHRKEPDQSAALRELDGKQRKALDLFQKQQTITSRDIASLFGFEPRTAANLCRKWAESGFLQMTDPSKKGRTYQLASHFCYLIDSDK
jgi:Fic family protein